MVVQLRFSVTDKMPTSYTAFRELTDLPRFRKTETTKGYSGERE